MNTPSSQPNPYAPPTAPVGEATDPWQTVEPAERSARLGAATVDGVIGILVCLPLLISVAISWIKNLDLSAAILSGSGLFTLLLAAAVTVYTIYLVNLNGQTIGKKLLGIKVVRSDGSRASLGRIFWLRNVVNALPSALLFVGNVYVLIDHLFIYSERRQCLHDKIADTIVIKAK